LKPGPFELWIKQRFNLHRPTACALWLTGAYSTSTTAPEYVPST
jgi:hypothetical protein